MNNQEDKTEQTLEKSARYIASYLKFELKKDLAEVLQPLCQTIYNLGNAILGGKDGE